jgi:hypothetical protein
VEDAFDGDVFEDPSIEKKFDTDEDFRFAVALKPEELDGLVEEFSVVQGEKFTKLPGGAFEQVQQYLINELTRLYGCKVVRIANGELSVTCLHHTANDTLTDVTLSGGEFEEDGLTALLKAVTKSSTLLHLDLSRVQAGMSDAIIEKVGAMLTKNTTLKRLALADNSISFGASKELALALAKSSGLKELALQGNGTTMQAAGSAEFDRAMNYNGILDVIWGLDSGRNIYRNNDFLRRVAMNDPEQTEIWSYHLVSCNMKHQPDLSGLTSPHGQMKVSDPELEAVAHALKKNTHVKELWFKGGSIGDAGLIALAAVLTTNTTVERLHLGENLVGDAGATALAAALKTNTTLKNIVLRDNPIGAVGQAAFEAALESNTTVDEIWGMGPGKFFTRKGEDGHQRYYQRSRTPSPMKRIPDGGSGTPATTINNTTPLPPITAN